MKLNELINEGAKTIFVTRGKGYAANPYTDREDRERFDLKVNSFYRCDDLPDGEYNLNDLKESEKWYCYECGRWFNSCYDHITVHLSFSPTRILSLI